MAVFLIENKLNLLKITSDASIVIIPTKLTANHITRKIPINKTIMSRKAKDPEW